MRENDEIWLALEDDNNYLYFGTYLSDGGRYARVLLSSGAVTTDLITPGVRSVVRGSAQELFFIQDYSGELRINTQWTYGGTLFNDFILVYPFTSNLIFHIFKEIQDIDQNNIDQLQYLGTPKSPSVTTDEHAASLLN